MPAANRRSAANLLLAAMPQPAYQHMLSGLEPVRLFCGQVLYEPAGPIRHMLKEGDTIKLTHAVAMLEKLIGQLMYNKAVDGPAK